MVSQQIPSKVGLVAPQLNDIARANSEVRRTYGRSKSSSMDRKNLLLKDREYDADRHCGVLTGDLLKPCTRSLTCKSHSLSLRRMVSGRSKPFDKLLTEHRATKDIKSSMNLNSSSRTIPEFESSNSSSPSSMDVDRRNTQSVSSNSNASLDVHASSGGSPSVPSPPRVPNANVTSTRPTRNTERDINVGLSEDNVVKISVNKAAMRPTRLGPISVDMFDKRIRKVPLGEPIVVASAVSDCGDLPARLRDDRRYSICIFSPESTVLTSPIRLLSEKHLAVPKKRPFLNMREDNFDDIEMSGLSEEKKLYLKVQRKVARKYDLLYGNPNRPGPASILVPPAAKIVAEAVAEENPNTLLTDAEFVVDPDTSVISISICGSCEIDHMNLSLGQLNQKFLEKAIAAAFQPFGISRAPNGYYVLDNPPILPDPVDEGFRIHHLPPLTEEEYNQMRPEFLNGMPKPVMIGLVDDVRIKKEEPDDITDEEAANLEPTLPLLESEDIKREIKMEPEDYCEPPVLPMEETIIDDAPIFMKDECVLMTDDHDLMNTDHDLVDDEHILIDETSALMNEESMRTDQSVVMDEEVAGEGDVEGEGETENQTETENANEIGTENENGNENENENENDIVMEQAPSEEIDVELITIDDADDLELVENMSNSPKTRSDGTLNHASEKENSETLYDDDFGFRGVRHWYGSVPKPICINQFGLVKMRGGTSFKKCILSSRKTNPTMQSHNFVIRGTNQVLVRRESKNQDKAQDSNSTGCNGSFTDTPKGSNFSSRTIMKSRPHRNTTVTFNASSSIKRQTNPMQGNMNPFFKLYNSNIPGTRIKLHKRSIIMQKGHITRHSKNIRNQLGGQIVELLRGYKKVNHKVSTSSHATGHGNTSSSRSSKSSQSLSTASSSTSRSKSSKSRSSGGTSLSAMSSRGSGAVLQSTNRNRSVQKNSKNLFNSDHI